jgi:hypothetical protein
LRRCNPLALQRQFGGDARRFNRFAALKLGVFDGLLAGDIARLGILLGGNTLRRKPLLLCDAGFFNRLARRNFGGIHRAVAGDLERTHLLIARYSFAGDLAILQMRVDSTIWRELISAASIASLRAISRPRVSCSASIRSAAIFLSRAMRADSVDSRAAISASSIALMRSISRFRVSSSATIRSTAIFFS